jgi:hypothetical protein
MIKHAKPSPKIDPADPNLIKPSDWNADHDYPAYTIFGEQFGDDPYQTIVPTPAALTEIFVASQRSKYDMTNFTSVRIVGNVLTPHVGAVMAVQYSLDQVVWNYMDGAAGPSIALNPGGMKIGAWVNLVAGAKADVFMRWVISGGNGVNGTQWYQHYLQAR